jgi:hypothetical protein
VIARIRVRCASRIDPSNRGPLPAGGTCTGATGGYADPDAEAHDEDQMMSILLSIRRDVQNVLPAFNACLQSIEVEPIAALDPETMTSQSTNENDLVDSTSS